MSLISKISGSYPAGMEPGIGSPRLAHSALARPSKVSAGCRVWQPARAPKCFLSRRRAPARDGPARPGFPRELASLAMAHCRLRWRSKQANFLHRIGRGGRRWRLRTMQAWCGSSDESSAWELRWPKFPHRTGPHLCETV